MAGTTRPPLGGTALVDRGRNPVTQQRQLRAELRAAREAAKLRQKDAADRLEWSLSKLIRIETGAVGISLTDLRALLQLYGVTDESTVEQLVDMARSGKQQAWWDRYRPRLPQPFVTFLGLEDSTTLIRQFQPLFVPGLLQTEDYARSVVSLYSPDDTDGIERGVEIRMERQDKFYDKGDQQAFFILDESALRRQIGTPQVMRKQLVRLKELNRLPFVSIQVIGFDKGLHRGMESAFTVFEFPAGDDQDHAIYIDQAGKSRSILIQNSPEDASRYVEAFIELEAVATPSDELDIFIDRIITDSFNEGAH
ncbi:helix-turn-helix domain-containing protein [Saccharothrix hoggarensis]|uniref:Helix-turn-helix domain-containing protein n=1 Tax=Saccharothrix hoggarensis TaxID=913853 RepID=A0ABW3QVC7_9PSEU